MKRFAFIFFLLATPSFGVTIEKPLPSEAQERMAQTIFHELKCVVCEGQALSESDALLARQMREEVRRMVSEGRSEAEILAYFSERYGEHILMRPPLAGGTLLLWAAPLLLVGLGGFILYRSGARA